MHKPFHAPDLRRVPCDQAISVGWSAGALVEFHVRPRIAIIAPVHFVQEGSDATSVRRRRIMVGAGRSGGIHHTYR
jgi:hypothetical protein